MEKEFKIIWAPRALKQADSAITYCLKQFGKRTALRFVNKLEKDNIRIKNNPLIGAIEPAFVNKTKEYRSLVEGHYKIIYTLEKDNVIQVVLLWDCRKNPTKLKTSIR